MPDAHFDPLTDPAATVARHPHLRHAPAAARNRDPIRQAPLAQLLPATPCTVLEIASGTSEHALWMGRACVCVDINKSDLCALAGKGRHNVGPDPGGAADQIDGLAHKAWIARKGIGHFQAPEHSGSFGTSSVIRLQ
jgi:hypothetical protein